MNINAIDLLSQLDDIQLPDPIGWWPLASSIWFVLVGLAGIIIGLIWYFRQRHQAAAYRREALQQLAEWQNLPNQAWLAQINQLLKQVAITAYGRHNVAGLHNQAWLDFLTTKAGFIEQPMAMQKLNQRYQAQTSLTTQEREAILYYVKRWIEAHHQ